MPKITLENGNTVEISQESYDALAEGIKKKFPQVGDGYYYVSGFGGVVRCLYRNDNADKRYQRHGNFFQTREEAEMYSLRIESLSWNYVPKNGEEFWIWGFDVDEAYHVNPTLLKYNVTTIKHKTKERCEEWGKKFGKAWEYLNK